MSKILRPTIQQKRSNLLTSMLIISSLFIAGIIIRIPELLFNKKSFDSQDYTFYGSLIIILIINALLLYFIWKFKKWAAILFLLLNCIITVLPLFFSLGLALSPGLGGNIFLGLFVIGIFTIPAVFWFIAIKNNWKSFN